MTDEELWNRRFNQLVQMDQTDEDPEVAHGEEDDLLFEIVYAVAHKNLEDWHTEAAKKITEHDAGTRWYA